jgi:hypothetical protein
MGSQTVYQLIYASSAKKDISREEIQAILEVAQSHNPQHGITGMLLYHGGIFLQLLEGEAAQVQELYAKIKGDPRHSNCISLIEAQQNPRIFEKWSMAYREIDTLDLKMVNEILSWNKIINAAAVKDNHLILHIFARFKEKLLG